MHHSCPSLSVLPWYMYYRVWVTGIIPFLLTMSFSSCSSDTRNHRSDRNCRSGDNSCGCQPLPRSCPVPVPPANRREICALWGHALQPQAAGQPPAGCIPQLHSCLPGHHLLQPQIRLSPSGEHPSADAGHETVSAQSLSSIMRLSKFSLAAVSSTTLACNKQASDAYGREGSTLALGDDV